MQETIDAVKRLTQVERAEVAALLRSWHGDEGNGGSKRDSGSGMIQAHGNLEKAAYSEYDELVDRAYF